MSSISSSLTTLRICTAKASTVGDLWCSETSLLLGRFLKGALAGAGLGSESRVPDCRGCSPVSPGLAACLCFMLGSFTRESGFETFPHETKSFFVCPNSDRVAFVFSSAVTKAE